MISRQPRSDRCKAAARLVTLLMAPPAMLLLFVAAAPHAHAQEIPADAGWRGVSVAEYRQRLQDLDALVAACQAQRALKSPAPATANACDARLVGPDDRLQWPGGTGSQSREVRYDWLRAVLSRAAEKDDTAQPGAPGPVAGQKKPAVTAGDLLTEAHQRLKEDTQQAANPVEISPAYAGERKTLNAILAQKAYKDVTEVSAREWFLEWFYRQLDKFFSGLVRLGSRSKWIVFALRALLLAGILTALIWFLVRMERASRVHLIPDAAPAPGVPSAREWQLWLKDAHSMADDGQWREAIHFVYWAAIARLESRRVWPADRARTPREYLGLLAGADPCKPALTALTRSFERTWYGGHEAASSDFHAALKQAATLGVGAE